MDKHSFLNMNRPTIVCMVQKTDPDSCISVMRNAACDGADAYGVQICCLQRRYRTADDFRRIFSYAGGKPVYVTDYRHRNSEGMSDDQLADELLLAVQAGALLVDVMGDMYDPQLLNYTEDRVAAAKQMELIGKVHSAGGQVLMSTHTKKYMTCDEVLHIAQLQQARGADIIKVITMADSRQQMLDNLQTTTVLADQLDKPFIFLANGSWCKLQRLMGPLLSSQIYLCVQQYEETNSREQPLVRNVRQMLDCLDWMPTRGGDVDKNQGG